MNDRSRKHARQLKRCLHTRQRLLRVVGAHNVLGARLIEQAGFDGIWASGLEIATSCGRVDDDSAVRADIVPVAQLLANHSRIPVIADGGTGADTPEEIFAMVQAFKRAGVAAVSFEDGQRPKSNSLLPGEHPLAPVEDFSEKIKAARSATGNTEFVIIARVEALIAQAGLVEALWRARTYAAAGADAILIHSKASSPEEVLAFVEAWDTPVPLVVVPTTYHSVTVEDLIQTDKVRMVIYANQGMRTAIRAMKWTLNAIMRDGTTQNVERHIATLDELFEFQTAFRPANGEATSKSIVHL